MSSTVAVKNSQCTNWASLGNTYSLHTGDPGVNGTANEVSGGGYSRQSTTWGTAVGGVITGSQLVFLVPALTAPGVTHMCRWNGTTLLTILDTVDAVVNPAGELKVTPNYTYPSNAD